MKNKTRIIFTIFTSICSLLMASISVSYAWFRRNYNKVDWEVNGSVLAQYFDKRTYGASDDQIGTTADNPFVITTYRHYENLVKLHHATFEDGEGNVVSFSDQHYYFEIGKQFEEGGDYLVYEFDDHGAQTGNRVDYLNLAALDPLEPIGSESHPFVSTIDGHGITVENFTVSASADPDNSYYDFGIFGYVGNKNDDNSGNISDIYFSDFSLDASSLNASGAAERDYHAAHTSNSYVGYLCGHVYDVNSFSDVYINGASLKGGSSNYATVNNYGYFGYVEMDNEGSTAGSGNNYNFDLNSSAIYDYFNEHYDEEEFTYDENGDPQSLSSSVMRVRDTEYDSTINSSSDVNFSSGVTKEDDDFRLVGDYYNGSSKIDMTRNYSMSTLGYNGAEVNQIDHKYKTSYLASDGSYQMPDESAQVTTYSMDKQTGHGSYYYYDKTNGKWTYYYSENETNDYELSISIASFTLTDVKYSSTDSFSVSLVIDDQEIPGVENGTDSGDFNYSVSMTQTESSWFKTRYSITFSFPNSVIVSNLTGGVHHIAALAQIAHNYFLIYTYYSGGYYGTLVDTTNVNQRSVTYTTGTKSSETIHQNLSLSMTKYTNLESSKSLTEKTPCDPEVFISDNSYSSDVYGREIDSDNVTSETYTTIPYKSTSFYYEFGESYASSVERQVIKESVGPVYIGDDPELVASGYSSKSIDIVGGGVTFSDTYLNLGCESTSSNITTVPGIGDDFYSTQYCAESLVLYLKKSPGNNMGTIDIHYTTIGAIFGITLKTPALKKGNSSFIDFDSLNSLDTTGASEYTHNDSGTDRNIAIKKITPIQAQAASLCAIDADGKVVAIFNSSGTLTSGSADNIDRYVIAVGVQNSASLIGRLINNTHITSIHFEYKAEEGYCSTLGRVDFRTSPDTIDESMTSSVFTLYFVVPSDSTKRYKLFVNYDSVTSTYNVTFYTNYETNIKVYLYTTGYNVTVNGTSVLTTQGGASPLVSAVSDETLLD